MVIKLRFQTFLFFFVLSNIISSIVAFYPNVNFLSLGINFITILYGVFFLFSLKPQTKNKKTVFFFALYSLWVVIMIFQGLALDLRIIGRLFSNPEFGYMLFFPLLIYLPKYPANIKSLIKAILICNIIYICFLLLFFTQKLEDYNTYEFVSKRFAYGNTFLLLLYALLNRKQKLLSIIILIINLFIALLLARRAQVFYLALSSIFAWYIFVFYFRKKSIIINILMVGVFFLIGVMINISQYFENSLSKFINRLDQDTRSITEKDFYNDTNTLEWVIGKGINGRFKTTVQLDLDYEGDTRTNEDKNYRYGIETGYLNTILKGGIIKLFLDIFIIINAIFLGLIKSRNLLVKSAAFFLLLYLATLYPENANAFNIRYALVWISVGLCMDKDLRIANNNQIYKLYFNEKR